jgi:DNA-binding MarR family transcriptional regulator
MDHAWTFAHTADQNNSQATKGRGASAGKANVIVPQDDSPKQPIHDGPIPPLGARPPSAQLPPLPARANLNAVLGGLPPFGQVYQRMLVLIGRLHAQLLAVVAEELKRHGADSISNIQALLLFNLGDQEMTVGSLETKGYYLGGNVSYNLKTLVENGYILRDRTEPDRRLVMVKLTGKGIAVCDILEALFARHLSSIEAVGNVSGCDLSELNDTLKRMQRFWFNQVRFRG